VNDIVEAKKMSILPTATYVFDKGYYDFAWWAGLIKARCKFVTRIKENTPAQPVQILPLCDDTIKGDRLVKLTHRMTGNRKNPLQEETLREITVTLDNGTTVRILTNDLDAPAIEIANLYKTRWQIELFFKWIKQNLRIKKFLGTSENAIKLQIIAALVAFLLIRITQHAALATGTSLHRMTVLLRGHLMHRKTIAELLHPPHQPRPQALQTMLEFPNRLLKNPWIAWR
jgi:IS4 transposase